MPTSVSSGTQPSTIGVEHELMNEVTNDFFFGHISLKNMASGDTVEIRKYVIIAGGLEDQYLETFVDAQTEDLSTYKYFAPEASTASYRVTLKHTIGTTKNFAYNFYKV
jgi:hypothetical protein